MPLSRRHAGVAALAVMSEQAWAFSPGFSHPGSVLQRASLSGAMYATRPGRVLAGPGMCLSQPEPFNGITPATRGKALTGTLRRRSKKTIPLPSYILHSQIPADTVPTSMTPPEPQQVVDKVKMDAIVWSIAAGVVLIIGVGLQNPRLAGFFAIAEVCFLIFQYLQSRQMNAPPRPEPVRRDIGELWKLCMRRSPDGPASFIEGWFYDVPLSEITREDMEDFISWALFSSTFELLTVASADQARHVIGLIEEELDHKFPPRTAEKEPLRNMRFSIEPIQYTPKPLIYYGVTQGMLKNVGRTQLAAEGFKRFRSGKLKYWIRVPETAAARLRLPIVFVHGVGVGLVTYMGMIKQFMKLDCPIICIELPFISSNIQPVVPRIDDQVQSIENLLNRWGIKKAAFVGHSYGSVVLSWMAQQAPDRVASLAFLDPVVFMLNLKDILYNFLYRHEQDGKISDLVGSELYLNNALRRNFWWYRNILWASDMQKAEIPTLVCLSEKDEIVPVEAVLQHLDEHEKLHPENNLVKPYLMKGANHGEMLFDDNILQGLVDEISQLYKKVDARTMSQMIRKSPIRTPFAGVRRPLVVAQYNVRQATRRAAIFLRAKGIPLPQVEEAPGRS
jgi:pimeloyl-ACP methyl ester carboxylesterase